MSLNPYDLTPVASLNRVRLVSGDRLRLPGHLERRNAVDLLSAQAVQGIVAEQASAHGLAVDVLGGPSTLLTGWLDSSDAAARRAGEAVRAEHCARIAYLIATLKLGEARSRAARDEWDDSYWDHWAGIERIYLGGGLAYPGLSEAVAAKLQALDVDCDVLPAPHAEHAPLIGAARTLRPPSGAATVLDCGGTLVKRGVARYESGGLSSLRILQPLPSPQRSGDRSPATFLEVIIDSIAQSSLPAASLDVAVSIASYVANNHLREAPHATYVDTTGIDNLGVWLERQVQGRLRVPASVRLIHDGTAAALAVSPSQKTALITTGTFLGVGFALPSAAGLTALAPGFRLEEAEG